MSVALNAAASAVQIAKIKLEVLANDVANKDTIAYKSHDVRTSDLSYTTLTKPMQAGDGGDTYSAQVQVGNGAKAVSTTRILAQGALKVTQSPLDIMINGSGYFAIELPNGGRAFTRDGSFSRSNSKLVTKAGASVLGQDDGPIAIKDDYDLNTLTLSASGKLTIKDASGTDVELGKLALYHFDNEQSLESIGNNSFIENEASGEATLIEEGSTGTTVRNKMLEASNVETVKVMMDLMEAQNMYETAFRIMEVVNKIEHKANEIVTV
jgi:flagellar basal-body rod protein FlgG